VRRSGRGMDVSSAKGESFGSTIMKLGARSDVLIERCKKAVAPLACVLLALLGALVPPASATTTTHAVSAAEDVGSAVDAANPAGFRSFRAAKTGMGSPGPGSVFDHVVEQSQIGRSGFSPEEIHNPFNMNPVSAETNQLKANHYSSKQFFTSGGTVRDWLTGQSFADQYEFGMDVLMRIEQGLPLP
jgi:hypothetical protein